MSNNFFPLNNFTDPQVWEAYKLAKECIGDPEPEMKNRCDQTRENIEPSVIKAKDTADQARIEALKPSKPFLISACHYLVLAQNKKTVDCYGPDMLFHFAANAFRDYGQLKNAAECYFNAAYECKKNYSSKDNSTETNTKDILKSLNFGKRSAGRAKVLFHQLGEDGNSDKSHVLQQRIRQLELRYQKHSFLSRLLYWLWDLISDFGTSSKHWFISTIIVIAVYAIIYPILIYFGQIIVSTDGFIEIHQTGFALISSSLLFSLGNMFQFGMFTTLTPITIIGQTFVILHGIIAFILLGTGATFLTRH